MDIKEAVEKHKLDRRIRWFSFSGFVTRSVIETMPCSGCSCDCSDGYGCSHGNAGCHECGYKGKRRGSYPMCVFDSNGNPIKTSSPNFTYYHNPHKKP